MTDRPRRKVMMMRQSNRTKILDAAARLVQREGVTSVTFDSVAAEADLTRGGLMYHFPSRDALIGAIHWHLADRWEAALVEAAGKSAEEAGPTERLVAYAQVATQSASRAELVFMLESASDPALAEPWNGVLARWAPPTDAPHDPAALGCLIARLAADGLWMHESLTTSSMAPELRRQVADHIATMIRGDAS